MRRATTAAVVLLAALLLAACGGDDSDPDSGSEPTRSDPQFGFNEAIQPDAAGNELIAESGATFVRVALNWASSEQTPGTLTFAGPDGVNEELQRYGLKPLWVVTSSPCWAAQNKCSSPQPGFAPEPDRLDDYAAFVVEVAKRYPDSIGIEVWNEPNIPNFWRPAPQADVYREMLAKTADAVHESGSDIPVVMAGPSPTTEEQAAEIPTKIPFVPFIEEVMSGPDAPDVDAIGTHPYSLLQRKADPIDESIRLFEEARDAAERAAPDVPVWVTEVGLTTEGKFAVEKGTQAEGLREIFNTLADDGVPVITVHRFFDQVDPPFAFEEGFGVVADDRSTRKESFCALAEAAGTECES